MVKQGNEKFKIATKTIQNNRWEKVDGKRLYSLNK